MLWCEAIRVAALESCLDARRGLDLLPAARRDEWSLWLADSSTAAAADDAGRFRPNGFTVTALQAALAAIQATPVPDDDPARHLPDSLHAAVRIGDDTDTVAAIAGALLGARWGPGVPASWRLAVHGWPGRTGDDLVRLAGLAVRAG